MLGSESPVMGTVLDASSVRLRERKKDVNATARMRARTIACMKGLRRSRESAYARICSIDGR